MNQQEMIEFAAKLVSVCPPGDDLYVVGYLGAGMNTDEENDEECVFTHLSCVSDPEQIPQRMTDAITTYFVVARRCNDGPELTPDDYFQAGQITAALPHAKYDDGDPTDAKFVKYIVVGESGVHHAIEEVTA
jgi:hypothetical protein